ncbi:hypothetical protein L218DRAFT_950699 [Marasmius fiardii PR-910]|nr:hypothetical protein L218DRAFT_950699 [Marasmius fiardii PR-910]
MTSVHRCPSTTLTTSATFKLRKLELVSDSAIGKGDVIGLRLSGPELVSEERAFTVKGAAAHAAVVGHRELYRLSSPEEKAGSKYVVAIRKGTQAKVVLSARVANRNLEVMEYQGQWENKKTSFGE